jgi:DNA-binding MarR family transcriptional regulator
MRPRHIVVCMQQELALQELAITTIDRVARELVGLTAVAVAEAGIEFTLVQYRLLVLLVDHGPLEQGVLASATRRSASTISRNVARLERRGLVERSRSESDLRRRVVALTSEGAELIERALAARADLVARRLEGASIEELELIERGAAALAALLGQWR